MNLKLTLLFLIFTFFTGCEKKVFIYSIPERNEIVEILTEKLAEDQACSISCINDGEAYFNNYTAGILGKTAGDTIPNDSAYYRFGRILNAPSDTVYTFDIKWDSALAWIQYSGTGIFKVVQYDSMLVEIQIDTNWNFFTVPDSMLDSTALDTGDTVYIYFTRNDSSASYDTTRIYDFVESDSSQVSFSYETRQSCIFKRLGNSKDPSQDWKLNKVSPVEMITAMTDSILRVQISSFFLYEDIDLTPSNLLSSYLPRDSLPSFNPLSMVSLEIEVEEDSTELYPPGEMLILHYGASVSSFKYRRILEDSDNDGVYEYIWTVHEQGPDVYQLWIDLMNMEAVFIPGSELHSVSWMIPYKVTL